MVIKDECNKFVNFIDPRDSASCSVKFCYEVGVGFNLLYVDFLKFVSDNEAKKNHDNKNISKPIAGVSLHADSGCVWQKNVRLFLLAKTLKGLYRV